MADFLKISRGYFRKIFGQAGYTNNTPYPLIPVACLLHTEILVLEKLAHLSVHLSVHLSDTFLSPSYNSFTLFQLQCSLRLSFIESMRVKGNIRRAEALMCKAVETLWKVVWIQLDWRLWSSCAALQQLEAMPVLSRDSRTGSWNYFQKQMFS